MIKRCSVILLVLILLTGCASNLKTKSVDEVMNQLSSQVDPTSQLLSLDQSELESFYFFEQSVLKEGQMKLASDTSTDQIAVFLVTDTTKARKTIDQTIEMLKQESERYFPSEAAKLEHACIINEANLFVVVVGEKANDICANGLK